MSTWPQLLNAPGLPGHVLTLPLSFVFAAGIALLTHRLVAVPVWRLAVWLSCLLVPLSYTWTANSIHVRPGCAANAIWPELITRGMRAENIKNILLFIPAGLAVWAWVQHEQRLAALVCALAAPIVIELGQLLVPSLNRACQLSDVVNNSVGVWIGFATGAGLLAIKRMAFGPPEPPAGPPERS